MTDYAQALLFLEAFPEAESWKVCVLTRDQKPLMSASAMSSLQLRMRLRSWLERESVHFFVRPLLTTRAQNGDPGVNKWVPLFTLRP